MSQHPVIGFVAHGVHSRLLSGAGRSALVILAELKTRYQFIVYAPREDAFTKRVADMNLPVRYIRYRNSFYSPQNYYLNALRRSYYACRDQAYEKRLWAAMYRDNVKLVHSNSLVVRAGLAAARKLNVPHIWHIRELPASQLGSPFRGWPALAKDIRKSTQVICVSRAVKNFIGNVAPGLDRKAVCVYNGVFSAVDHTPYFKQNYTAPPIRLCMIGGIHPSKGQHIAVEAVRLLLDAGINAKLSIIGSGQSEWLDNVIKQHGVQHSVSLLGRVDDPIRCLGGYHISLICSENEAMGRVTAESLVLGIPTVATVGGATGELLEACHAGAAVNRTPQSVANRVAALAENYHNAVFHASLSAARARDLFSNQRCAEAISDIYGDLLSLTQRSSSNTDA